jgi:tetratricopeptide (TPR) repeat protein
LTRKWLSELLSKLRPRGATTLAVINPAMHQREEVEAVIDIFDGAMEIPISRDDTSPEKILRMRWMHGINVSSREISLSDALIAVQRPAVAGKSVAVIDFGNMAGASDVDWLSGAIAETVTVDLKKISALKVASREKVSQVLKSYSQARREDQILQIGKHLAVGWVIWGAFQKLGNNIRITAHLTDVNSGELIGSTKLDGVMEEIFQLQDKVITTLMNTTDLGITSSEMQKIGVPETSALAAYEHFAKGRQLFTQFGWKSLESAQADFEKALLIDSDYALAHSGLGSIHIFRFIQQTDPRDLEIGIASLEKAIKLDSDLGEPYQWLTYAYTRKQRFDEAITAGQRAVQLEPENFLAQYFLGTAYTIAAATKHQLDYYGHAVAHLDRCVSHHPKYGPAYMMLAWIHSLHGNYELAEPNLRMAVEIEESGTFEGVKFVGALTMLGNFHLRQNQLEDAMVWYERSLTGLVKVDHLYKNQFLALTHCGMAEVNHARGVFDKALEHYKLAAELAEKNPKSLGIGYILVKAHSGSAMSFHKLAMKREAELRLEDALRLLNDRRGYDFSWMWDGSDAQAYYDVARSLAVMNKPGDALDYLNLALNSGWRDAGLLQLDESWALLRKDSRFQQLCDLAKF